MSDDKTEILMIDSLTGKKLTREQADIIVNRMQANTDSAARFDALEDRLEDVIADHDKAKKVIKWLIGFLVINYGATFRESFEGAIMGIAQ